MDPISERMWQVKQHRVRQRKSAQLTVNQDHHYHNKRDEDAANHTTTSANDITEQQSSDYSRASRSALLMQRLTGRLDDEIACDADHHAKARQLTSSKNMREVAGRRGRLEAIMKSGRRQARPTGVGGSFKRRLRLEQILSLNMVHLAGLLMLLMLLASGDFGLGHSSSGNNNNNNRIAVAGGRSTGAFKPIGPAGAFQLEADDRQVQLLRSANVELTRRSQRLQRDAISSADGSTSPSSASNQPVCGYPGSPAHASVTFNTSQVVVGTAASYTCDNGYELLGPPKRICQANGTWSPIGIPFCVLNVGLGKAAMQSSTAGHGSAQKAVDGSTSPYFQASTCTMTDVEANPWWYVNLLEPYLVQIVRIDFGTACCANRQKATIAVRVGNNRPDLANNPLCNRYHGFIEEGKPLFLPCTRPAPGAFVSIHLESPSGSSLSICETFIYTDHALSIEQCPSFRDQPLGSTATYNGKCYLFHNNQALNFDNARKYCESRGGTLVDETSPALQGFLSWELYRRHRNDQLMGQYWLGAVKDTRNSQNWKWINGKDVQISFWNSPATQGNCSRFDGSKGWLWSDTDCNMNLNFICQYRPLSCGKPEKPTNSTLITKNIDNGTVIEYQCAPGNLLMGPKSRACLPTGFFSEFAPKCKYLDCQFPAMIPNGDYKLLNGSTSYESVVNYYCNEGYQIYGKATLTCDVDERWNGPPPRCEPLLCPAPVPPSNGYVTVTSNITVPGTQATYDCRPGYELVGDHLLTCSSAGSWDNSFPYCREKRAISPLQMGASPTTSAPSVAIPAPSQLPARFPQRPAQSPSAGRPAGAASSSIQFPQSSQSRNVSASSSTTTTTTTTTPPPPMLPTSTSLPASLNGLAGQFQAVSQQSPVVPPLVMSKNILEGISPQQVSGEQQQQNRKASQSNSVSQFAVPPMLQPPTQVSSLAIPTAGPPQMTDLNPVMGVNQQQMLPVSTQQPPPVRFRPTGNSVTSGQQMFSNVATGNSILPSTSNQPVLAINNNQRQQQQQQQQQQQANAPMNENKFTFSPASTSQLPSSGSYEAAPVATTNSVSVLNQQQQQQQSNGQASQPISSVLSNGNNNVATGGSLITSTSTMASAAAAAAASPPPSHSHSQSGHQHNHHHHHPSVGQNVLASFSPPVRAHNTLAGAKYSLDGIIAVAIFGGFIFLGAIITIIVIIIRRRKSSHSSSIDAQTISTYDSNNEHNGLYRNYQQAWENLRFATPNSQPKSSGNAEMSLIAHAGVVPGVGLKNFTTNAGLHQQAHLLHHPHHMHHSQHPASGANGHHNLAMSGSTSSGSSQSSSLGGGGTGAGALSGADPLLRGHHHHHLHGHHHVPGTSHHLINGGRRNLDVTTHHHDVDDDDDDDNASEQGVLSTDEINYRSANEQQVAGEGFRDTNELTINADTVVNHRNGGGGGGGGQNGSVTSHQQTPGRRRLYSGNSIGRSMAAASEQRLSVGSGEQVGNEQGRRYHSNHHHHHHHHSHHSHHLNGSSQDQRLVSSSTPSTSTRSSRASPPSEEHSLDQLAYGNSWHPNLAVGSQGQQVNQQDSASSNNHSAGSGASILGANRRY